MHRLTRRSTSASSLAASGSLAASSSSAAASLVARASLPGRRNFFGSPGAGADATCPHVVPRRPLSPASSCSPPLFFGRRRRYPGSRRHQSSPFVFVQHQPVQQRRRHLPPTTSSTPTIDGDIGLAPIGATTVAESSSLLALRVLNMAYSSCRSLIYACMVLATTMCAFVHDVSPGKPGRVLHKLLLCLSVHAHCWHHRCVPSSTRCPRVWQT